MPSFLGCLTITTAQSAYQSWKTFLKSILISSHIVKNIWNVI